MDVLRFWVFFGYMRKRQLCSCLTRSAHVRTRVYTTYGPSCNFFFFYDFVILFSASLRNRINYFIRVCVVRYIFIINCSIKKKTTYRLYYYFLTAFKTFDVLLQSETVFIGVCYPGGFYIISVPWESIRR